MDTLASRLATAMTEAHAKIPALVRVTGMSYPGIKKILEGKTSSIQAENLFAIAEYLGVQPRWLSSGEGDMRASESPAAPSKGSLFDTEAVHIPHYATGGAMGHGLILRDQPGVIREIVVSDEWLQKNTRNITTAKNLVVVTGFGDSMRPIFQPGDPLLVDIGVTTVDFDGIYFFRVENEGFVKRLQRIPGEGLVAISENKAYREWTIKQDMDFQVFGRVVKAWSGQDY